MIDFRCNKINTACDSDYGHTSDSTIALGFAFVGDPILVQCNVGNSMFVKVNDDFYHAITALRFQTRIHINFINHVNYIKKYIQVS